MAGILIENFNEYCRLCAIKIDLLTGINIFENEGSAREISKKISVFLPIQIHEDDSLPKMICSECVYKLDVCFQFYEKCLDTQNLFIEIIRKDNIANFEEKIKKTKILKETIDLVTTIDDQQIHIVQNSQELLNHSSMSLPHELTSRENMIVSQQMILNTHDNISMHNHELDSIEISPHELNSHGMTHDNLHNQQLALHESTMVQLVQPEMQISDPQLTVQNLELIHTQHNLIANHYKSISNNDNNVLISKDQRDLMSVKDEEVKSENKNDLVMTKTNFSDTSDSDDSSDPDFDPSLENSNSEMVKNDERDDLIHNNMNMYEDENNFLLNEAEVEVGTSENSESNQYYCNVCGASIYDKDEYLEHYGEHLNKCLICQEDFANLEELAIHRKEIHLRKPDEIEQSTSQSTGDRIRIKTTDALNNEYYREESSDEENSVKGEQSSEFMNDDEDDIEENEEDNNKNKKRRRWEPKVCRECGKSYKTNYKLAEHMRKHTGEQPFKCTMCEKAFRSKIGLAQHEAKHTGQYDYSCPTCGKGFQCKSYLIVHQRVHSNLKPFPCDQCGRNFKTKQSLLDHMNRHLGVKPFMCDICGRGFITKGLCKSHQKVHSGRDNRQYPCTVCNKLFVSKSYLNTHSRIHTGEKPFMCEVCGKGFLTRVDLRIHSTMHTGEKSFVCEICGKAFARRDALRCHRRSHTGERPYRCDICGQTFTQFSPMAIHKRLHTGERPYACEVCNKTFVSRSTMMSHRKKHVP